MDGLRNPSSDLQPHARRMSLLFRHAQTAGTDSGGPAFLLPISVAVHQRELKADEAVEVRVVVPRRLVQEEDVPVGGDEHEAGEAVETAQHDAQGPFGQKHTALDT